MTSSNLRTLRRKHELTQAELATKIGMDASSISRMERGNRKIPHYFILLLIEARLISRRKALKTA